MTTIPLNRLYIGFLGIVLFGYMALNRGFAYIGANPIFIGEITLALGFLVILAGAYSTRALRSPIAWALMAFMTWHAFRTLPYIDVYGVDALRDAVLWAYGLFAFVVAGVLIRANAVEAVPEWYGRVFPWVIIVGPVAHLLTELFFTAMPMWPGTDTTIIFVKAGDLGVQLAGVVAFLALGLHLVYPRQGGRLFQVKDLYFWAVVITGALLVLSRSRGGFVAIAAAAAFVFMMRPANRMVRLVVPAVFVAVLLLAFDVTVPLGGGREFSAQQVMTNFLSIFTDQDEAVLDNTETWRITWWTSIINDTVFGDRFWLGRGYGVSHAVLDGFVQESGNRSPHNAHINFLGRGGVPGLIFWLLLLGTVYWQLFQCYRRALQAGRQELASINLWVMAWLFGFIAYMSFEVYMEGPQGGIPFWCLIGFAIALTEAQRVSAPEPQTLRRALADDREDPQGGPGPRPGGAAPGRKPSVRRGLGAGGRSLDALPLTRAGSAVRRLRRGPPPDS